MTDQEKDSSTGDVYRRLPTANDLKLHTKPCDICESTERPVRFWGGSSVLICNKSECAAVMAERWDNFKTQSEREDEERRKYEEYYEDDYE